MSSSQSLDQDNIWFDKGHFEEAEIAYQEHLALLRSGGQTTHVAKCDKAGAVPSECFVKRVGSLEEENKELKKVVKDLELLVNKLISRVAALEHGSPAQSSTVKSAPAEAPIAAADKKKDEVDADDDFELFGSDEEEDAEAERVKQERLKSYEEKKSKKPVLIAKSNIILDVKPWDDETDMVQLEKCVRSIEMDGLLWGASKLVPLAYGIKKLQISCVVEDDKVGTEDLEEKLTAFEDYIQSMDIAAFNKI